jgi:hypothetical protein
MVAKMSMPCLFGVLMIILVELAAVRAGPVRRKRNIDIDRAFEIVNNEHRKHESILINVEEKCSLECPVNSKLYIF